MEKKITSIETKKEIKFKMKEITMPLKEEFNDSFSEAEFQKPIKYSLWTKCARIATELTDEDMLSMTDMDVYQVVYECAIVINCKKKSKK